MEERENQIEKIEKMERELRSQLQGIRDINDQEIYNQIDRLIPVSYTHLDVYKRQIIWYVTLHTASGFWVAAFSIGSYLPQFLISFFGGICADRYHRKACIICADAGIALVTFCMMILMPFFVSEISLIWALLFMAVLRSVGAGICLLYTSISGKSTEKGSGKQ